MNDAANNCVRLSKRAERLLGGILLLIASLSALLVLGPERSPGTHATALYAALGLLWLLWLALMLTNYRLVRCGPQAIRYEYAPRFINRPETAVRLLLHLFINWSAIIVTVVVAWMYPDRSFGRYLLWAVMAVTAGVWLGFNMLHRRMNRLRNLSLSTSVAVAVLGACWWILA